MMDRLQKNLLSLARIDRALAERVRSADTAAGIEVITAKSGDPTLVRGGISLHSRIDPWREANGYAARLERELAGGKAVPAVFGLGLGYHVLALLKRFPEVVVIEPDPGMIKLAFRYLDFTERMPGLHFFLDRDSETAGLCVRFFAHGPSARLDSEAFNFWSGHFDDGRAPGIGAGPVQTAGQLRNELTSIQGMERLLDGFAPGTPLVLTTLAQAVRDGRGPLSEGAIYTLLLHELARE